MAKHATPLLDQLETGPWPSFVSDLKQHAEVRAKNEANIEFQIPQDVVEDLLGILELSYEDGTTHWKHGGIVGVFGYGGGVIGRYCDQPEISRAWPISTPCASTSPAANSTPPNTCASSATCGISAAAASPTCTAPPVTSSSWGPPPPAGRNFLRADPQFNQDLGGSGSNLRTPADCIGQARCEYACYDTQALCYTLTQEYQDELHRPAFPYKFKFKFDGCPNCCVASIARPTCLSSAPGKTTSRSTRKRLPGYIGGEFAPNAGAHMDATGVPSTSRRSHRPLCPTDCMWMEDGKLKIDNKECTRCMHCINVMPRALHIGDDRGCSILVGAKAPILDGAQMGSLLVPFVKVEEPYDEIKEVIEGIWDWWMEEGKNRERLGELMKRQGFQKLLEVTGIKPVPQHVQEPRHNPYIFWKEDEVEGGWDRDINEFRKDHQR
jgi:sulfite reductase alpha subunit